MFLRSLKKRFFNLCLKLLSEFVNFRSIGKLFQTIGVGTTNFFDQNTCFLKDVLVSKQKFSYLLDFDQSTSSFKKFKAVEQRYWLNLSETGRQLNFSKCLIPMWLLLYSWRQYLILLFWTVCIYFWMSYSDFDTKLSRHN